MLLLNLYMTLKEMTNENEMLTLKVTLGALAGVAQWIEPQPANQRVAGSIRVRAHAWVVGQVPWCRACKRQPHIHVSLPLFLPPFPSV